MQSLGKARPNAFAVLEGVKITAATLIGFAEAMDLAGLVKLG